MYQPSEEILNKYASLLVNFGLGEGKGIKKGDTVALIISESARPMLIPLQQAILKAGGNIILNYRPEGYLRPFYNCASEDQLSHFPQVYMRGYIDQIDHFLMLSSTADPQELKGVPGSKLMMRQAAMSPYMRMREEKEQAGKLSWTLALYGTEAMAKEAEMSSEEYWTEIISACYLDSEDPVLEWKNLQVENHRVRDALTNLNIESLHVKTEHTDLTIGIGSNRQWMGITGHNIPSYELYVSPNWRMTQGHVQFTEPLYVYGNLLTDVYLRFENGLVVESKASQGEDVLKEMIAVKNADRIGEFSLTDKRASRISKFMGETLYDENVGAKDGNFHLALGNAYKDGLQGDITGISEEEFDALGFNTSVVHTDIVSTEPRVVTATLEDGSSKIIYRDGQFTI